MGTKKYLSELPREEVVEMLKYPSELHSEMYEMLAEVNGMWASSVYDEVLGKDNHKWIKFDQCSYDWWIAVKPGYYRDALDIDTENYFSDEDAKELKELKEELKKKCGEIDDLGDDDDYYDKLGELEDEADEIANKMLKIVEKMVKQMEEVPDDQIVGDFFDMDYGDRYYVLGDDHTKVYQDVVKSYKVGK